MTTPLLAITDLRIAFGPTTVVDSVSFAINAGEIVGIVGESGSGKSLTARSVLRLTPRTATIHGHVHLRGEDVLQMSPARLRALRGAQVAMIFQDPMTSFDPVLRIGAQIGEAVSIHHPSDRSTITNRVKHLLASVGIADPERRASAYPGEFSGGMRQRAMIAMAVANEPALLIADEPTTALDVTVQDQIMQLMRDLNAKTGTAILLITHNIAVVASLCQRVIVMYAGRVVEDGPADAVLLSPQHPYTWLLLQSVPRLDDRQARLVAITGQPPDPAALPAGCKFAPRCPFVIAHCLEAEPALDLVEPGHHARCWVLMKNATEQAA